VRLPSIESGDPSFTPTQLPAAHLTVGPQEMDMNARTARIGAKRRVSKPVKSGVRRLRIQAPTAIAKWPNLSGGS
jgi:hypothetical protein